MIESSLKSVFGSHEIFLLDGSPISEEHMRLAESLVRVLRNNDRMTVEEFMSTQTIVYEVRRVFDKMSIRAARDPRAYIENSLLRDLSNMGDGVYKEVFK